MELSGQHTRAAELFLHSAGTTVRIGSRPSIGQNLTKGLSGSGVTPPIARRSADYTCKDAREMALVRKTAGDGHFGERSI